MAYSKVVEEGAVAHHQEDEEVVQHQHQEAAEVGAVGQLLLAQGAEQRARLVQGQGDIDRPARGEAQVVVLAGAGGQGDVEQEIAVPVFARGEGQPVAGGHDLPAAFGPRRVQGDVVHQRVGLAQYQLLRLGAVVRHVEAHPPRRLAETDFQSGGRRGLECGGRLRTGKLELARRVFEHFQLRAEVEAGQRGIDFHRRRRHTRAGQGQP
jgi:hypothetical protein